ncbi:MULTISPECIES: universal stress protein [Halomonas]|uniref:universal stress protein n=1 Tax=Halomonas TaxID=2745 RepID=UPI001A908799|nr:MULTISPECIES: universal stress protein [Halomonas]MED5295709.1 universal stress protein [Pseudomonadota bacterium]MBN8413516.1 universal stress protein [Halomonas litopenaei]MBY5969053.1 universal stress protein [Halomonas denitrificans]MBY6209303.1 universal stress protein [Halomonas sp. DP3Y7-2]MBY6229458.1 universal stress protein [Halomonas sp. DP3Y7-1]
MFTKILVPVDGSCYSREALKVACTLLNAHRSDDTSPAGNASAGQLVLLHVPEELGSEPAFVWGVSAIAAGAALDEREAIGREILDNAGRDALSLGVPKPMILLRHGSPGQVILDAAREHGVDAIVMGHRGMGKFKALIEGSVSRKVSHHARCRVVTVH